MDVGRVGIWTGQLDGVAIAEAQELVAELEERGFGAVWVPEAVGRDSLVHAALLLAATRRIPVATGISSIWWREPQAMNASHRTISEAFPDRFLLGIGASHGPAVEGLLHREYVAPFSRMKAYLDAMDEALFMAASPATPPRRVLAALGPKMLDLAARRADGAHPYFVPVEHTAYAREILDRAAADAGRDRPLLAVEQAVVLETDPAEARRIGRAHAAIYLGLPNYTNNLKRHGLTDDDLADGGSDRLVDAIVAWGDEQAVRDRVDAHLAAGADHVCLQVMGPDPFAVPAEDWRRVAGALL